MEPITVPRFLGGWWIPDVAVAALRIAVAGLLLLHGVQEHYGLLLRPDVTWLGAPDLLTDRWIAGTVLIVGGTLLALGAFTRFVSLSLAVIVSLAWYAPLRARGHWNFNEIELIGLCAAVLVTFAIVGPGLFSVDALREGRHRPSRSGTEVPLSPWIKRQYRRRELTR